MMSSVSAANTLEYDAERCADCGLCIEVCPRGVFAQGDGAAEVVDAEACMECGACQLNCPAGAIRVESGVGCAYALMLAALTGKRECDCCGGGDTTCC